mgnify:FL=1
MCSSDLPAVRRLVRRVTRRGLPVLIGGAAVASMGPPIVTALGARYGISGPADDLVWRLGRALVNGVPFPDALPDDPRIIGLVSRIRERGDADAWRPVPGPTPRAPDWLALARAREGRVPVAIAAGCDRRCHFCVEPSFLSGGVRARPVEEIVHEIGLLRQAGVRRIWLATSELNVPDARHAKEVLGAIARARVDVELYGFLQPSPVDDAFLDALEACGVDPAALSWELGHLDDRLLRAGAGPANRAGIDRLVGLYQRRGYRQLGGSLLLGAHPLEDDDSVERALAGAREIDAALPDGLGLAYAAGGRIYAESRLGRWVRDHLEDARPHLYGPLTPGFVAPVVYCKPGRPRELLRRIREGLAGNRGPQAPLNAEAPASPSRLRAELHVHRAILASAAGDVDGAVRSARTALRMAPDHPEALRQLGLTLANRKGDLEGAREVFERLAGVVDGDRRAEVDRVLSQLRAMGVPGHAPRRIPPAGSGGGPAP